MDARTSLSSKETITTLAIHFRSHLDQTFGEKRDPDSAPLCWLSASSEVINSLSSSTNSLLENHFRSISIESIGELSTDFQPDVILWLLDHSESLEPEAIDSISNQYPLANHVAVLGPMSAGSGRCGVQHEAIHYVSWIQLPYQWLHFQFQWKESKKTIWNQYAASSRKERLEQLIPSTGDQTLPNPPSPSFFILSRDQVFQETIRLVIEGFSSSKQRENQETYDSSNNPNNWADEIRKWTSQKNELSVLLLDHWRRDDSISESIQEVINENPNIRTLQFVPYAETEIPPQTWREFWIDHNKHLLLGKPFHNVELQAAVSYLCF